MAKIRARSEAELVAGIDRGQTRLAEDLRALLDEGVRHTRYLAAAPDLRGFLLDPAGPEAAALEARLLPYLVAFPRIDRLRLLDREGRERLQLYRQGGGVALLPTARLASDPDRALLDLAATAGDGVAVSGVELDAERVEVVPDERRVMHCVAPVTDGPGAEIGHVVLTVYAAPLLGAVRRFAPAPDTTTVVVDGEGHRLDVDPPAAAFPSPERLREIAVRAVRDGRHAEESGGGLVIARAVKGAPLSLALVTVVPAGVRDGVRRSIGGEYLWTVGSTLLVTIILGLAALFFLRMSERGFRLRETERFLDRIRRESDRARALLDASADLIAVVDARTGETRETNPAAARALARETGGAATLAELVRGEADRERFRESLEHAASDPGRPHAAAEFRIAGGDGVERTVEARFVGVPLETGPAVLVSLRDRTEQLEMERRLRTADRLSSLGLLTAGVAHEINNPLAAIGNYLVLLQNPELEPEKRDRYLGLVRHGFERIRDIVRDLLRIARPDPGTGRAELGEAVRRAISLLDLSQGRGEVVIEVSETGGPRHVAADAGQVEQVALNLLLNAVKAMDGVGRVLVSVREAEDADCGGPVLDLVVEDEGPGVPEEDLERIFDPFFTTGGGTGLGLSVSYGSIRAAGGRLWAERRAGGGARFVVRLPAAKTSRNDTP
ncbi:MAG: ATP-binding protein [Planctomycetota bacterium]